jgi:two-component system, cell cycle sensor histidine kinase PleC
MAALGASTEDDRDQHRWLQARVDLVVSSLPLTIVLNPIWAALSIIPLGGQFPSFGSVSLAVLGGIIGLHLFNSLVASGVQHWARTAAPSPRRAMTVLLILQVWVSTSWGGGVLMCWDEGNPVNNVFLALLVIAMIWALAFTRSIHPALLFAGIAPLASMFWLRAIVGAGEAAQVFTVFTPVFAAYAWFMGASARDRVNEVLRSRFAIEDMAQALEAAKNEAVAKGAEAEAASASKSAFVANMSHELRTPLNAILGFAEIIESASMGPEVSRQYRDYAGDIRDSGAHLLSLINDMLDVAKIESGRMELDRQVLDAAHVLDAAVRLVAQKTEAKGQTVSVAVEPGVRPYADERAFKQIVLNLLSNATKFSPGGSIISVRCVEGAGGSARIVFEDAGPGIPADKLKHLFKPFSQIDNRYDRNAGGTGLGLSLVRGLVALHGGRVWVENKSVGTGLIANVEFPPREVSNAQAA